MSGKERLTTGDYEGLGRIDFEDMRTLVVAQYGEGAGRAIDAAFNIGASVAVEELRTTNEVALELGVTPRLVRRYALDKGIGKEVGRDWLFSAADVEVLRGRKTVPGPARRGDDSAE